MGERETSTEQHYFTMPVSKRYAAAKSSKYNSNIHKRNNVTDASQAKKYPFTVGPIVLAFFLFVILGSSILEVIMSIGRAKECNFESSFLSFIFPKKVKSFKEEK